MRIVDVEFKTHWLDKVTDFYQNQVGLELIEKDDQRCVFKAGWSRLKFVLDESSEGPWYHFAFHIPLSQIESAMRWAESFATLLQNIEGKRFYLGHRSAEAIYFEDPSGNIVELIGRKEYDAKALDDFSSESILGIAEVGLPVVEFDANDRSLRRQLGVGYAVDPTNSYAAIGNREGMLVLIRERQHWFPTKREAEIFPMKIALTGPQRAHVTFAAVPYLIEMERNA